MAKKSLTSPILLRWSAHVPASDVQDPLGLALRGSARLASQLLYCITSITPRARYFSFIPWCIFDFQQREEGKPYDRGWRDAVALREQVLTLGCIAHHKGEPCEGGALVGSRSAKKWFAKRNKVANFKTLKRFSKNPALGAYLNSLVNLRLFVAEEDRPDTDEDADTEGLTVDEIDLSPLGLELAKQYDSMISRLAATKQIASKDRTCSLSSLAAFGKQGGLCELSIPDSADRLLLRNIFFGLVGTNGKAHPFRRRSLLLTLELCRQFGSKGRVLNEPGFAAAVYYGTVDDGESQLEVSIPPQLVDIATRWRMFYFHHYMAVAIEGLFSWLVSALGARGLAGDTVQSLVARLDEAAVRRTLREVLGVRLDKPFGVLSPANLFTLVGIPGGCLDEELGKSLDDRIRSMTPFAEDSLEDIIRSNEHLYSSTGLERVFKCMFCVRGGVT